MALVIGAQAARAAPTPVPTCRGDSAAGEVTTIYYVLPTGCSIAPGEAMSLVAGAPNVPPKPSLIGVHQIVFREIFAPFAKFVAPVEGATGSNTYTFAVPQQLCAGVSAATMTGPPFTVLVFAMATNVNASIGLYLGDFTPICPKTGTPTASPALTASPKQR
jgi:hypothetical protein